MSKIKNGGLDQYGVEPFEQQQFETVGVKWVNAHLFTTTYTEFRQNRPRFVEDTTKNIPVCFFSSGSDGVVARK